MSLKIFLPCLPFIGLMAILYSLHPDLQQQYTVFSFHITDNIHHRYWTLFTSQFIHLNASHAFVNIAALFTLAYYFHPHLSLKQWWIGGSCSIICIALWLYFIPPAHYYAGSSGWLHGIFLIGALQLPSHLARLSHLAALIIKLCVEYYLPFDMYDFTVAHDVHWAGIAGAVLYFLWVKLAKLLNTFNQ